MRYISLILALTGISMAKVCGNLTVTSQHQIETQGLLDCTIIVGDLEIASDFVDVLDLKVIAVTGNVIGRNLNTIGLIAIPGMTAIGGNLELTGSFFSPSLPSLRSVDGNFKVLSANGIVCSNFDDLASEGVRGTFECREEDEVSPAEVGLYV